MTRLLATSKLNKLKSSTFLYFSLIFFLIFTLSSCYKPAGQIGDEIQPDQSKLKVFYSDTSTVYAYSIPEDSVRSDELTRNQLGSIVDPVFGNTKASFYTQFALSSLNQEFNYNPVMDSLFLYLYYDGFYGDTTTQLKVGVYKMEDSISLSEVYYSNIHKAVSPIDYANYSFYPKPYDSIIVDGDTLPPMLRINLSDVNTSLGEYLLKAQPDNLASNEAFQEYFKGLYVTCEQVGSNGSILYFNLLETFSRMIIHYHNDSTSNLYYNFLITSGAARVNRYEHDFSTGSPSFKQQVVDGDKALGTQQFYIQGIGGVKSVIKLPFISEWSNLENVAVNEAKLILSGSENPPYNGAPAQVILVRIKEDGSYQILEDNLQFGDYFGGQYKSSVNQYQFRITQYIQERILNPTKPDYGLYLYVYGSSIQPQRFIFNGNQPVNDSLSRLRLEMIYTDL